MPVLYLTEDDVRSLLTMDLALEAVEAAFRKLSLDEAENIPRHRCQTDGAVLHVLPAAAKTLGGLGLKAYTTSKAGAQFHVFLYDPKLGGLTAIIAADYLGQMRTGAASGVATKRLARKDAASLGLYGTGKQARTQLLAIAKVRSLKKVHVYSREAAKRLAFAAEMSPLCGIEVIPVETPEEAAHGFDIICTATASREPVLFGSWIAEGSHLNIVGSNFLAKTEIDAEVVRRASRVVVDSKEQAKCEAGDFVAALRNGSLCWGDVTELAHIVTGRYPGRESPQDITLFKSLGLGIEDVAVGVRVLDLARKNGVGIELPF